MIEDNKIYHYCSLDTLGKILEYKKLWLNDHRFFNDSLEAKIGLFWFEQAMKEAVDNEQFIKTMQAIQKSKPYKNRIIYCICFSTCRDLLSQWRGYSNDGRGVAITWNFDLLKEAVETSSKFKLDKIQYKPMLNSINDNDINEVIDAIRAETEKSSKLAKTLECYDKFMLKSIFYKNEAFVEEQEWRMIVNYSYDCGMLASYGAEGEKHNLPKPVFEIRNEKIKSHIEFDFKEYFDKGIIKEIMIGSKAEFSESDLKMYLATKGITDIKVTTTKATYR